MPARSGRPRWHEGRRARRFRAGRRDLRRAPAGCAARTTSAIIHSSGNAWRVARLGIELTAADVLSPRQVRPALAGSSHVVDCTAGATDVLVKGMSNILAASAAAGSSGWST